VSSSERKRKAGIDVPFAPYLRIRLRSSRRGFAPRGVEVNLKTPLR
jgi:hypothetical protein